QVGVLVKTSRQTHRVRTIQGANGNREACVRNGELIFDEPKNPWNVFDEIQTLENEIMGRLGFETKEERLKKILIEGLDGAWQRRRSVRKPFVLPPTCVRRPRTAASRETGCSGFGSQSE